MRAARRFSLARGSSFVPDEAQGVSCRTVGWGRSVMEIASRAADDRFDRRGRDLWASVTSSQTDLHGHLRFKSVDGVTHQPCRATAVLHRGRERQQQEGAGGAHVCFPDKSASCDVLLWVGLHVGQCPAASCATQA